MAAKFRVGVDPGWGERLEALLGPALREFFAPGGRIEWEVMPAQPAGVARPETLQEYDGILAMQMNFPASSFAGVDRPACIARWGVGFDRIDVAAATAADVLIALTPTAISRAVAEAEMALIFALSKQLPALDKRTRAGRWREDMPIAGADTAGKTLASVGLGRIAAELFRMARGIGFGRLLAYDPYCPPQRAAALGVEPASLEAVMAQGDFITVNTLLNAETRGLIDARLLALMKPSAYFINTARGPIVDEPALIRALQERRIAGAGIDVFAREPPRQDHPFFSMDNVIVTPHAVAWTREGLTGNSREACANLARVASGEAPPHMANPEAAARPGVRAKLAALRAKGE